MPADLPACTRRQWLAAHLPAGLALAGIGTGAALPLAAYALPERTLVFPSDHGSHPELRTEWWYITGHAQAAGRPWGFQVTFFRSRVDATQGLQSAFAAKQLVFAHAAVTDVQGRALLHDQRIARAGFGVAEASTQDTNVRLQDWTLVRSDLPRMGDLPSGSGSRYVQRFSYGSCIAWMEPELPSCERGRTNRYGAASSIRRLSGTPMTSSSGRSDRIVRMLP